MGKDTGNTARGMASAPLHTHTADQPETAMAGALATAIIENKLDAQAAVMADVKLPFALMAFKLNGKAKDYPTDDGKATQRTIAFAGIKINGTGIVFPASISMTVGKEPVDVNGVKKIQRSYTCKFPNQGRATGYKPLFETDNPREENAIAAFRRDIAKQAVAWIKTLETRPDRAEGRKHGEDSVVEFDE
jgi:hypothetical protein